MIPETLRLITEHGSLQADGLHGAFQPVPVQQEGQDGWLCHAYTALRFPLPSTARRVKVGYGLAPGAYEKPQDATDGVEFIVQLQSPDGAPRVLHRRFLNPAENPADRGMQSSEIPFPSLADGDSLVFITHPGPSYSTAYDWSYWTVPKLETDTSAAPR